MSAHGTATDRGDLAESLATHAVLGAVLSSMKSYLGHTLGACGAIEAWWAIEMMRAGCSPPRLEFVVLIPCAVLDHFGARWPQYRYRLRDE